MASVPPAIDLPSLSAIGWFESDDPGRPAVAIRLVVGSATRRAGRGPIELAIDLDELRIGGASLVWLVTTNKGWAHLRGLAEERETGADRPFRADLCSAQSAGVDGPDLLTLRIYGPGADPNVDSPTIKLQGHLPQGSVRLSR